MNITLTVNKANVYTEVAKTTSYAGAKDMGEGDAYNRIFTTDEDRMFLERFWAEAANVATRQLSQFLIRVSSHPESHGVDLTNNYEVELRLSSLFDTNLVNSIESSLFSYFVMTIVGKWYKYSNKPEADSALSEATGLLEDVVQKVYHRKRPTRVDNYPEMPDVPTTELILTEIDCTKEYYCIKPSGAEIAQQYPSGVWKSTPEFIDISTFSKMSITKDEDLTSAYYGLALYDGAYNCINGFSWNDIESSNIQMPNDAKYVKYCTLDAYFVKIVFSS